jgi:hypothetical protein
MFLFYRSLEVNGMWMLKSGIWHSLDASSSISYEMQGRMLGDLFAL